MRISIETILLRLRACRDPNELMDFWKDYHRAGRTKCETLLEERFPRYTKAVNDLALYASNRAAVLRTTGETQEVYKLICSKISCDLLRY